MTHLPTLVRKVPDLVRTAFTEPLVQCDAFTAEAGAGNAAAVVFSQRKGDAQWMQKEGTDANYYTSWDRHSLDL